LENFNSYDVYVTKTHKRNETSLKVPNTSFIFVENIQKKIFIYIYITQKLNATSYKPSTKTQELFYNYLITQKYWSMYEVVEYVLHKKNNKKIIKLFTRGFIKLLQNANCF